MTRRTLMMIALALLIASAPGRSDADRRRNARREEREPTPTDLAIERGVAWLLAQQKPDGSWPGFEGRYDGGVTALSLLALLKSGIDRDHEAIRRGFDRLRRMYLPQQAPAADGTITLPAGVNSANGFLRDTYSVTVTILALEALYHQDRPPEEEGEYNPRNRAAPPMISGPDLEWMRRLHAYLLAVQHTYRSSRRIGDADYGRQGFTNHAWRYPAPVGNSACPWDNSNTQYALLALKACDRCGIQTPDDVWYGTLNHFLERQDAEGPEVRRIGLANAQQVQGPYGEAVPEYMQTDDVDRARGWHYVAQDDPMYGTDAHGSMTVVGIASLVISRSMLHQQRVYKDHFQADVDRAVRDGIAWLDQNWSVTSNPRRGAFHHYYYLYGLERVGMLAQVANIGSHLWYPEGERYLLDHQAEDGHWEGAPVVEQDDVVDTCFALLFLKRGTTPVEGESYQVGPAQ